MDNLNNDFSPNDKNNSNENYFGFDDENIVTSGEAATSDEPKFELSSDDEKEPKKAKKSKNKRNGGLKKTFAFISCGLICAVLGGVIGGASVAYIYKDKMGINGNRVIDRDTEFTKEEGTLTAAQAVQKVAPAVVGVSTKSVVSNFFNSTEQEGLGSGFIVSEDGLVLTNYHVIQGANEVKVILSDGKEVNAKVVNYDAKQDIAALKITDDIKVPGVAELGDSSTLFSGEDVIAIGNPLGKEFSETVTKGVVSSPNRKVSTDGVNTIEYIQTDAAINPGNSGGPLINSRGQIIGINTAKKVGTDIEGIGFSIPINAVKERLESLSKPILLLGITARDIDEESAKKYNLQEGVYVVGVGEFSVAEKAGIRNGDLIIKFGGERVKTTEELNTVKQKYNEGDTVKVTLIRDGKEINVDVKLTSTN